MFQISSSIVQLNTKLQKFQSQKPANTSVLEENIYEMAFPEASL